MANVNKLYKINFVIRLNEGDPRLLLDFTRFFFKYYFTAILKLIFLKLTLISFGYDYYASARMVIYFPVKSPNYFIAEAPSNSLLIIPFN